MTRDRIVSLVDLEAELDRLPEMRLGLVLANGIFDLFHVGHVRYLEGAKAEGRHLLVAVNSDASARKIKGPGRPLLPLEERMEIVAALGCVDRVTWFEEMSVETVLTRMRPAVHAKGTDYTVETVPERAVAERLGIRTVIVGDPKRHASTQLMERIRRASDRGAEGSRSG